MKLRFVVLLAIATVAVVAASLTVSPTLARAVKGFRVMNGLLLEANGEPFVIRGTNHMYAFYPSEISAFSDAKRLGANTLRIVLSGGRSRMNGVDDVETVVKLCKQNELICVLDNHDTGGFLQTQSAWTLDRAADYWISVKNALIGQEKYVLINVGNEPYGDLNVSGWLPATNSAVQKLRNAGFQHTLVVDAPNFGQDKLYIMRDNASEILGSDPYRNILFSVHMYGAFITPEAIVSYMDAFRRNRLPLLVGEFGNNSDDEELIVKSDANTIMAEAVRRRIGYLSWCWSGNSNPGLAPHLDQVEDFDANRLTEWGSRVFHGPDGIGDNSVQATVYSTQ